MDIAVDKPRHPHAFSRPPSRSRLLRSLHGCLAERIAWETVPVAAPVIDLSPRKGALSRALISRGVREENLVLVDRDNERVSFLRGRHPAARILCVEATQIATRRDVSFGRRAGVVVSRLALARMAEHQVAGFLDDVFQHLLHEDGALYQITSLPRCPVAPAVLQRLGLYAERVAWVFWHLPPVAIYRINRPWLWSRLRL